MPRRALPDAPPHEENDGGGGGGGDGGGMGDGGLGDGGDGGSGDGGTSDGGTMPTDAMTDAMTAMPDAPPLGPIDGGPCISGAQGQTAYRIRWAGGSGASSTAYPVYEVHGLPDPSPDHAGAYGYQIGYTPRFEDIFLAQGGLVLDGSNFVDLDFSTAGVIVQSATLSIYGRSFNTTTSGSFHWQSFQGVGAAPTNLVSNSAPYEWYSADLDGAVISNTDNIKLRIKAGPNSGVLVVNRIEICIDAS